MTTVGRVPSVTSNSGGSNDGWNGWNGWPLKGLWVANRAQPPSPLGGGFQP